MAVEARARRPRPRLNYYLLKGCAMEELRFDDRVAVITGAGRGLGRAYATLLAARGAAVVVNDLGCDKLGEGTDPAPAHEAVEEIVAAGGTAVADTGDVSTPEGAESLVALALARFGRVDILVNNAGIVKQTEFMETDERDLLRVWSVHALGTFRVTRAAWPSMATAGFGRVVLTTSTTLFGRGNSSSYNMAKGAIFGLGRTLADAGAALGIYVNMVAPLGLSRLSIAPPSNLQEAMKVKGRPSDVAALIGVLCHESCPVNGEMYSVGKGRVARLFLAETAGHFSETPLSPETVRASWQEVNDSGEFLVPRSLLEWQAGGRW